jgi:hypothetical protein
MPKYSYWAAAYGHLASYVVMFVISAVLGAKYYPIPYRWGRLLMIFLLMGAAYGASLLVDKTFFAEFSIATASSGQIAAKLGVHTALILAYPAGAWKLIRRPSKA